MLTSIIISAYNEEKYIKKCLEETIRVFNDAKIDYEIIVAADGCTDDTVNIASEYLPLERILMSEERLGKGGGIMEASRLASGSHILIMDADLSVHPQCYFDLVRERADLAIGCRSLESYPRFRWLLSRVFNVLFRFMFKLRLSDTQCGFKLVKREVLDDVREGFKTMGFAYDVELLVRAHKKGYKIVEVPVFYSHNMDSKVETTKQSFEMGVDLMRIWYYMNEGVVKRFAKYSLIAFLFGYLANLSLIYLFERFFSLWWGYGMFISALMIHFLKFLFNEHWTWG